MPIIQLVNLDLAAPGVLVGGGSGPGLSPLTRDIRYWAALYPGKTPLLKTVAVTGVAPNTDIAVSGILLDDILLVVLEFSGGVPSIVPATISSRGNIRSSAATTGNALVVHYYTRH